MASYHALSSLLVVLLAAWGHCSISVISEVVPTEGDSYLMKCHGDGELTSFMLHGKGEVLQPVYYERLRINIYRNASIFFESISLEHVGLHTCIRNKGGSDHAYPTPLEVRPLPSENLWEDVYKAKFITGFLAALVIASLFILGCVIYKNRWEADEPDKSPIITNSAYVNPAMVNEDTESGCSTKM